MAGLGINNTYLGSDQYVIDRELIRTALNELGISANALARKAGVSGAALSQAISGKYLSCPSKIFTPVLAAIDNLREQKIVKGVMPFVETSVYKLAKFTCDEAFAFRSTDSIGLICGQVGVGKTTALKHYVSLNSHAIYLRGSIGMHKSQLLESLSIKLRIPTHDKKSQSYKHAAIVASLSDTPKLIVLDEASRVTRTMLEALRDMTDEAESGLVFGGREILYDKLSCNTSELGEIASRILTWNPPIRCLTEDDIMLIVNASDLSDLDDECKDMVWQCSESNARVLQHLITKLSNYQKKDNQLTPKLISDIYRQVVKPMSTGWQKATQ